MTTCEPIDQATGQALEQAYPGGVVSGELGAPDQMIQKQAQEGIDAMAYTLCNFTNDVKTPGELVSHQLNTAFDLGPQFAVVADEISEAIDTIVQTLINEAITSSVYALSSSGEVTSGGGLFASGLDELSDPTIQDVDTTSLVPQIDQGFFSTHTAVTSLDGSLIGTRRQLFDARKKSDVALQELNKNDLIRFSNQKAPFLTTERDLATLKITILGTTDTAAFTDAVERAPTVLYQLGTLTDSLRLERPDIPAPPVTTGSPRDDALIALGGMRALIQNEIIMLQETISEIDRTLTATITPDAATKALLGTDKIDLRAKIDLLQQDLGRIAELETDLRTASDAAVKQLVIDATRHLDISAQDISQSEVFLAKVDTDLGIVRPPPESPDTIIEPPPESGAGE